MNKRFSLSILAFFAGTMAIAYPWHMVFFHEQYMAMGAFTRGTPIMPFGMLAILLQAIVFAYFLPIYLQHKGGGNVVANSIKFSLFLGLTVYSVMVFATAAKFQIEPVARFVLFGTTFQFLQFLLVGLLLGVIHKKR